jgi:hypothetical protein
VILSQPDIHTQASQKEHMLFPPAMTGWVDCGAATSLPARPRDPMPAERCGQLGLGVGLELEIKRVL